MIDGDNGARFPNCNSFLWIDRDEITIFDPQCGINLLERGLKTIDKTWKNIRYIINTHFHADHTASNIMIKNKNPEVQIMIHKDDGEAMEKSEEYFKRYGLDEETKIQYKLIFETIGYHQMMPNSLFEEGDFIPGGFKVIHTPGHTPGHCCFYKSDVLISGDIDCTKPWLGNKTSNFGDLLKSINKILKLDIEFFLPGHGNPILGRKNIQSELKIYRQRFLKTEKIILNLIDGVLPFEEIVSKRNQGRDLTSWRQNPLMGIFRKFETLNYLLHLQESGKIYQMEKKGIIFWKRK